MSRFDLTGRSAVVTGGSRGIGLAVACALREHGAQVASWSRDPWAASDELDRHGILGIACDIGDRTSVRDAQQATVAAFGQVDVVVANAARPGEDVLFPDTPDEEWDAIIATDLTGAYNTLKTFAEHAIERGGGGKAIVMSSIGAEFAMPRAVAYATAKAGLLGLTRSAAAALARHDVQVNCVAPGWVETEMSAPQLSDERIGAALVRHTPARRFGTGTDLAGICVYLASDASAFHTGDTIHVDGGFLVS